MPNFAAIEFCEDKLLVTCAKSAGRQFQVFQMLEIDTKEAESDEAIGEELKSLLADMGLTRAELIGVVGRDQSEVREMNVPPAPDNELPDLVRFQARNVFASLSDNWQLDFIPFAHQEGEQQRRVLAAAIAPQVLQRFEKIAAATGFKLKRIVFQPFALTHLYASHLSADNSRMLVMPNGQRFDLVVATQDKLVATRTFRSSVTDSPASAAQLASEARRTIASTKRSTGEQPIDKIIFGAGKQKWESFETPLAEQTGLDVAFADPVRCLNSANVTAPVVPEDSARFAGMLGALVQEYSNQPQVLDFLNPRKPIVKKRDVKRLLIPALAAGLLFLLAGCFGWYSLNKQAKLAEEKQDKLTVLKNRNEGDGRRPGVEDIIGEVNQMDKWRASKVNWLDELAWISEKLLTADDLIITRFKGNETPDGAKIDLESRMTEERSQDSSWKEEFARRYLNPSWGALTNAEKDSGKHKVKRDLNLLLPPDIDQTVDLISEIAFENRERELELQEVQVDDTDADASEATTAIENQTTATSD